MPLQLFDGSDSDNDDISKIEINEEYARRFEHNKRREDLHRFEELKKKGVIDSPSPSSYEDGDGSESDSSDDDDNEELFNSRRSDKEFIEALLKVKQQDPVLKQKDVKLFESDHSSEDDSNDEKTKSKDKKGKKPMYIKDVNAKHLLEEGADFGDKEEETFEKEKHKEVDFVNNCGKKTYFDEQEELKRAFLEAVEKEGLEDGEGDFLSVKEKGGEDKVDSDEDDFEEKLNEYFGEDEESNENAKFLKSYFRNKMWLDKSGDKSNVETEDLERLSDDEMELERQEEYEYRFQENPGDRVLSFSRKVEGSVRKKTNSRKEQRKSKEERVVIAQKEREEELKHLKNLKKQEIQEKLQQIKKNAGIHGDDDILPLSAAEIEEEFDSEEYDRMMEKAFGKKYYETEDADLDFCRDGDDMEKPDFEKEDELLGLPKDWESCESGGGFLAAREKALKEKIENKLTESENEEEEILEEGSRKRESENEEEEIPEEGSRKRKRKIALLEKARQAMMDEYYKLDYEDTIGDLKTRFKYAKTKPNKYGISASEILLMDDQELNQYVSMKKLAPYREEEWKLNKQKKYMLKMRARELLRAASLDKRNNKKPKVSSSKSTSSNSASLDKRKNKKPKVYSSKPTSTSSNSVVEIEKPNTEESNTNMENLSRKARRKLRNSQLKIPLGRELAYGKTPSNVTKKKKKPSA